MVGGHLPPLVGLTEREGGTVSTWQGKMNISGKELLYMANILHVHIIRSAQQVLQR